ncbi:MAG: hypothetical protein KA767_03975, partial [Saprospiraceae bacterium]|nr:hypothetical protein [Saprospiraceae bacterium]
NQYTITRTYVATDACGNTSSSSQIIQVDDQISPTIISIPLDELVSCELNVSDPNTSEVISNDNCESSPSISVLPDVIQNQICDNRYTIARTYVATDACGNTTSSTQTITVYDETGPRINSIPEDLIVSCESEIPETSIGLVQSEDECGGQPGISVEPDIITNSICASQFTVLRTYVATDGCGNTSSSTQTIEVKDETSPTITSIPVNETISCEDLVPNTQESEVIATDNCEGNVTISVEADVISNYICINQYRITRTYVATDACGNYSTASQIIEVDDQTSPEITSIPENETVDCEDLVRGAEPNQVIATDNCDVPTITVESDVISNYICANQYTITRTYVATDACGNYSTAAQIIEVDDRISPQITQIPNDVTVSCSALVAQADPGLVLANDNCDVPTISVETDVISNYVCANQYTITRTYVATDACGNTSSSSQIIQVDDQTSPTINYIPENLTLSCAGDVPEPNIGLVSASDNCGATIISVNEDVISNQICANQYTITRTYVATDACENITTRSQQIDVSDQIPPNINFTNYPPSILNITYPNQAPSAASYGGTAFDDCYGSVFFSSTESNNGGTGCQSSPYIKQRTWRAIDLCGNVTEVTQEIVAIDDVPPTFTVPSDENLDCDFSIPGPVTLSALYASDSTGVLGLNYRDVTLGGEGNEDSPLYINRYYSVTDVCNNTSSEIAQQLVLIDYTPGEAYGDGTYKCPGEARTLYASGGDSYLWENGEDDNSTVVTPYASSNFIVGIKNENGCITYASTDVLVNSTASIELSYSPGSVSAYAEDALSYTYYVTVNGNNQIFNGPSLTFTQGMGGGYLDVLYTGGCKYSINISPNLPSCSGPNLSILRYENSNNTYSYYLNCGNVSSSGSNCSSCDNYIINWNIVGGFRAQSNCAISNVSTSTRGSVTVCYKNNTGCCTTINF